MNTMTRLPLAIATLAAATTAHAAVTITLYENAGNVVADYSGSLNTASSTFAGSGTFGSVAPHRILSIHAANQILGLHQGDAYYYTLTAPAVFGTGAFAAFSEDSYLSPHMYTTTGSPLTFGFSGSSQLAVDNTYASGSDFSGTTTFASTSLTALGITLGTTVHTLAGSGDTVTVNAIPEPAAYGVAGAGALALVAGLRRRRR